MKHEDWEAWGNAHDADDQRKRLSNALSSATAPTEINVDESFGIFVGGHGTYTAHLSECNCRDFVLRGKPCKHMYRLAAELGLTDNAQIADGPKAFKPVTYEDALAICRTLPDDDIALLSKITYELLLDKSGYPIKLTEGIQRLIDAGVFMSVSNPARQLAAHSRNELIKLISSVCPEKLSKPGPRDKIILWVLETIPEHVSALCEGTAFVVWGTGFTKDKRKLNDYAFHRKTNPGNAVPTETDGDAREISLDQFVAEVNAANKPPHSFSLTQLIADLRKMQIKYVDKTVVGGCLWFESTPISDQYVSDITATGAKLGKTSRSKHFNGKEAWYVSEKASNSRS